MKTLLKILLFLILFILLAMIVIPIVFKDQILNRVQTEINKQVEAKVAFSDLKLSLFRNFPKLTISLHDLSVAGIENFEGDTLVSFDKFSATANLMSVIRGDQYEVNSITLDAPLVFARVLEDGSANWDIVPESTEVEEDTVSEGGGDFNIALEEFRIRDAGIVYVDEGGQIEAELFGLDFLLSGDLASEFTSIQMESGIKAVNLYMGGIRYINQATYDMQVNLDANMKDQVFTLKENRIALNELALEFEGSVAMIPEDQIDMDLVFHTSKTDFRSLLSMVPAIYLQDFGVVQTGGTLALEGYVRGTYNAQTERLPSGEIRMLVENGRFAYPDLPKSAENINVDLVAFLDGVEMDNSRVNLKKFHIDLGTNPVDMTMNLRTPISDPQINATLNSTIDFNTLSDVVPMENTNIRGILSTDIEMMGRYSYIEQQRYEEFKADGDLVLADFIMQSPDLPQDVTIKNANLVFSPQFVALNTFDAMIGSSDLSLRGRIDNFIGYLFNDEVIQGSFNFTSSLLDLNEFMSEEEVPVEEVPEDTVPMSVIEVPGNIDFRLESRLDKVLFQNMEIERIRGLIEVRDKRVLLSEMLMELLQGTLAMSGEYNTRDMTSPLVDLDLDMRNIDIPSVYQTFNTIEQLAPIAGNCKGRISVAMEFTSFLQQDMTPVMNSIVGSGHLSSEEIEVNNAHTFEKLSTVLKNDQFRQFKVNDLDLDFEIRNGRVYVDPFDIKVQNARMVIAGDQGLDQTMNYLMSISIPRGNLGKGVFDQLSTAAAAQGIEYSPSSEINMAARVTGTFEDPRISLDLKKNLSETTEQIKQQVQERAEEKIEEVKTDTREKLDQEAQSIIKQAEEQAEKLRNEAKAAGDKLIEEAEKEGQKRIEEAGNNPIQKRLAEEYARKLKSEAEEKADRLYEEADQKAEAILKKAREEADKLK